MAIPAADIPVLANELPATILALFDDPIDAEHALQSLRKGDFSASHVSLLVRSREASDESVLNVARDLVAAALGAVANWLTGLAELIVVEQGRFLVAGPMGAALSGAGKLRAREALPAAAPDPDPDPDPEADYLQWVLTEFGFAETEATYVEQRLAAGATLLAISTEEAAELAKARDLFHDQDAIFVSMAPTDSRFLADVDSLVGAPPVPAETVVVADMVAPVREEAAGEAAAAWRGRSVVATGTDEAGTVERVLVDDGSGQSAPSGQPRYVIVSFGGIIGLGRRRVIVPAAIAAADGELVRIAASRELIHAAPTYDEDVPLTRRDEERAYRHFGLQPYW